MDNSNPIITAELGGKEYTLRFNARAWRLIKETLGFDFADLARQQAAKKAAEVAGVPYDGKTSATDALSGMEGTARLFWAACQNSQNGSPKDWPTFDWVEDTIDLTNMAYVLSRVTAAIGMGADKAKAEDLSPGKGEPK